MTRRSEAGRVAAPAAHPWERSRLQSFSQWEAGLRQAAYGSPVGDLVGFAFPAEPPLGSVEDRYARRLVAVSPLPTGDGPVYLATVGARQRVPTPGALVRFPRPFKGVVPSRDGRSAELVLDAKAGAQAATWEELLPGVSPRMARTLVPKISELWRLPRTAIELLLLPLVGSTPWHGFPAGVDLHLEMEGWSQARHRDLLQAVLALVPTWVSRPPRRDSRSRVLELASGVKVHRRSVQGLRPFSVQIRPISKSGGEPAGVADRAVSHITYGAELSGEFVAGVGSGRSLLLLPTELSRAVQTPLPDVPDPLRQTVWGLHWWTPEPPDTPDWNRWLRAEEVQLTDSLSRLPPPTGEEGQLSPAQRIARPEFRARLVQSAIARARLRAASEVEAEDLHAAVDSLVEAVRQASDWRREGRGPLARPSDRTEGARSSRVRQALAELARNASGGLTPSEAAVALGPSVSEWEVETQLENLRIRGLLFQDRSGRYRLA